MDVDEADVALAALDTTDVGSIQAATMGEFFLRESLFFAERSNPPPDSLSKILSSPRAHLQMIIG